MGKASVFQTKYNSSCNFIADSLYLVGEAPFYYYFVEGFYEELMLGFVKYLFCVY